MSGQRAAQGGPVQSSLPNHWEMHHHNEEPVKKAVFNYEVFMTCSWIRRGKKEIEWNRTDVELTQMLGD